MKWPNTLTIVRHGESTYNVLKAQKEADPLYQELVDAYELRKEDPDRARKLAEEFMEVGAFVLGVGDHETPLTEKGKRQAEVTGKHLSKIIELPDVIFVSPYDRTHQTLEHMKLSWPALADVKEVEDDRIREQEHGLALNYNDWRVFHIMHPEQADLYELEGPYWYRYPQGQNVPDVRGELRSFQTAISRDYHGRNILAVSHHITTLGIRANLERLSVASYLDLDRYNKPRNCSITKYDGDPNLGDDGKLILSMYNEVLYDDELAA